MYHQDNVIIEADGGAIIWCTTIDQIIEHGPGNSFCFLICFLGIIDNDFS